MFGYACSETPELMPAPIYYAHTILRSLAEARHSGADAELGPDAKSQVTAALRERQAGPRDLRSWSRPSTSTRSRPGRRARDRARRYVRQCAARGLDVPEDEFLRQSDRRFVIGGPDGDAGLTGRKIIVDTYGGAAPHGGGAFSGKDPTKVDRSAAYAARYLAKNVVAAGLAERCTIQLSYAIGVAKPLSVYVDTHGTGTGRRGRSSSRRSASSWISSPRGIREHLGLNRPIYARTAAYGHFGRAPDADGGFSWERLDLVDEPACGLLEAGSAPTAAGSHRPTLRPAPRPRAAAGPPRAARRAAAEAGRDRCRRAASSRSAAPVRRGAGGALARDRLRRRRASRRRRPPPIPTSAFIGASSSSTASPACLRPSAAQRHRTMCGFSPMTPGCCCRASGGLLERHLHPVSDPWPKARHAAALRLSADDARRAGPLCARAPSCALPATIRGYRLDAEPACRLPRLRWLAARPATGASGRRDWPPTRYREEGVASRPSARLSAVSAPAAISANDRILSVEKA